MGKSRICPYCLAHRSISARRDNEKKRYYACAECLSTIPREYAENRSIPVEVISAVGFRGHGKTLYFSSLFYSVNQLASIWPDFYSFATDERSLDTINDNIVKLKNGDLPPPNPASFPIPTNVRFCNIPVVGSRFFLFYDTGGEAYTRASKLIKFASFIKRSRTVIFLISPEDLDYDGARMHELLSTYVQGLVELGGSPQEQNLVVVFSKADMFRSRLEKWQPIWKYLAAGGLDNLANLRLGDHIKGMFAVSAQLEEFTRQELHADQFINFASDQFANLEFSIISSLGARPVGSKLQVEVTPRCIFDPLLWVVFFSLGWLKKKYILWKK